MCTPTVRYSSVMTSPTFVTIRELGRTPTPNGVTDVLRRGHDHGEEEDDSDGVPSVESVHGVVVTTKV